MAVQAQYPSNLLFPSRSEQERPSMEFSQAAPLFLEQSQLFFSSNGGRPTTLPVIHCLFSVSKSGFRPGGARKRGREDISTGLKLAFEDREQAKANDPLLSEDLATQSKLQTDEIDRLLRAHLEELRRDVAERRRRDARALATAAEEAAARRLRDKEAELDRATRRAAELEGRLARLRSESLAWQAKAAADHAVATALHAQLQQATAAAARARGKPAEPAADSFPAEDAESAHLDPNRPGPSQPPPGLCRSCRVRHVSVVLLPCRHLCLCGSCDAKACPVCGALPTGSVHVFLS